jgi:ABC-2 type transport system permease protein
MNKLGPIIGFTFKNKARTKSFTITTLIIVLMISIGMNIPYFIDKFNGDDANGAARVGVVTDGGSPASELLLAYTAPEGSENKVSLESYASAGDAALLKGLDEGDIKGYLTFGTAAGSGVPPVTYHSNKGKLDDDIQSYLQTALQQVNTQLITEGKLTPEEVSAIFTPVAIETQQIGGASGNAGGAQDESIPTINYVIVYVLLMLFFFSIMLTGNMIAAEVTSEKSSRIMEILITSASPLSQMFGKVIGVFLVGLLQIAIIAASISANLLLPHNSGVLSDFDLDLSQLNPSILIYGFVLYILGFFLYALLYAAVGSIVSRTEELGQASMPVMMLGFVNYYIPTFSVSAPDTLLVKIASYVPFTSPLSMLLRIGVGEVATWEIAVSLLILLVSIFLVGWLAAKIYRTGVLMYGKRPSIKEIRKAMKAYKI